MDLVNKNIWSRFLNFRNSEPCSHENHLKSEKVKIIIYGDNKPFRNS